MDVGELYFTKHAQDQMGLRNIIDTWVKEVVAKPVLRELTLTTLRLNVSTDKCRN